MELEEEDLIGRCGMGTGIDNTFELFWCKGVERKRRAELEREVD